jgi:hypothetical protein
MERIVQLPLSVFDTDVNWLPIEVLTEVTTPTRAAPIRATIRAYSTIATPSSSANNRSKLSINEKLLRGKSVQNHDGLRAGYSLRIRRFGLRL